MFGKGDGVDEIAYDSDSSSGKLNTLLFKAGVAPSELVVTRSGLDILVSIAGTTDSIFINNFFNSSSNGTPSNSSNPIQQFKFNDGTVWNLDRIRLQAMTGGAGNDTIVGSALADTITGGAGNDLLYGYDGNDTYVFGKGDGVDEIAYDSDSSSGKLNTLLFKAGVAPSELVVTRSGSAILVSIAGTTDSVFINNFFSSSSNGTPSNSSNPIQQFVFNDGTVWNLDRIRLQAMTGGVGDDTIVGSALADTITGGAGNDLLYGYDGNDTYVFGKGDGVDEIAYDSDSSSGKLNTLLFKAGVAPSELVVTRSGSAILVSIAGTADSIFINNFFSSSTNGTPNSSNTYNPIQQFVFNDGTVWNLDRIRLQAMTGGAGNDTIVGSALADTITGGAGNDLLYGYDGNDTYVFGKGDGVDEIAYDHDTSAGKLNILLFKAGIAATDLLSTRSTGTNDLIISIVGTTDSITINDFFYDNGPANSYNPIQKIEFADGTSWTLDEFINNTFVGTTAANTLTGTLSDDYLSGGDGNDSLIGLAGNDTLTGGTGSDTLVGGLGNDAYVVDSVTDAIIEATNAGTDTVYSWALNYNLSTNLENLNLMGAAHINGTGNATANTLIGNSGNNILSGGAGNDALSGGAGNDNLLGGSGNDILSGGVGNDTLDGGYGSNTLKGGGGDDTYVLDTVLASGFQIKRWETKSGGFWDQQKWTMGDFNGDGKVDLVNIFNDAGSMSADIHTSTGTSFSIARGETKAGGFWDAQKWAVGDFNGDGKSDLVNMFNDNGLMSADVHLSNGSGFQIQRWESQAGGFWDAQKWATGDFNGDGKADLVNMFNDNGLMSADVHLSNGSGFEIKRWETKAGSIWDAQKWMAADVNGDGKADLINIFNDGGLASVDVHVSTGTGFEIQRWETKAGGFWDAQQWSTADVNGDGKADLINVFNDNGLMSVDVHVNTGTGFQIQRWETKAGGFWDGQKWMAADVTGDGKADLMNVFSDLGSTSIDVHVAGSYAANADNYVKSDNIVESAAEGVDTVVSSSNHTLAVNVENLTLSNNAMALVATGNALNNILKGNGMLNTLNGLAGNDTLQGGRNRDTLNGGVGNDTYLFARGDGMDQLVDADATVGNKDTLWFNSGVSSSQLWFQKAGNNLVVSVIGTTDQVTINNWYTSASNQVEQIKASDGKVLLNNEVAALVSAMSAFTAPAAGTTTLPTSYQTALNPVLAANWS